MLQKDPWLLPEGIEEVLPGDALDLDRLRQKLLKVFATWGYELVIPPMIDFLDSLLTGSGHDLDLQTFKLIDQLSGELLGIRADITPQVARIDAHKLRHEWPARFCYVGTVLHALGDPLEKTRSPVQIGAELFGHAGIESDKEIIFLMLEMLAMTGLQNVHLDLGHVGIYRGLSVQAGLTRQQEGTLFDILQRKATTELLELLENFSISDEFKAIFLKLPELHGGIEILDTAREILAIANDNVIKGLTDLEFLAEKLGACFPSLPISFDLAELRGYHYHTGVVFAAFVPEVGREITRGGRYDSIGAVFGRSRPATGFSADLKMLTSLASKTSSPHREEKIFAPCADDIELTEMIKELRARGRTVIQQLPGQQGNASDLSCTLQIEKNDSDWIISSL